MAKTPPRYWFSVYDEDQRRAEVNDFFEQYWRHASALRNWLVAFGVGGCMLLLTDKTDVFALSPLWLKILVLFFLMLGTMIQIVLALINKYLHWHLYYGTEETGHQNTKSYKISLKLSKKVWIDQVTDIITMVCYLLVVMLFFIGICFKENPAIL